MEAKITLPITVEIEVMKLLPIHMSEYSLNSKNALYESKVHLVGKMERRLPAVAMGGPKEEVSM